MKKKRGAWNIKLNMYRLSGLNFLSASYSAFNPAISSCKPMSVAFWLCTPLTILGCTYGCGRFRSNPLETPKPWLSDKYQIINVSFTSFCTASSVPSWASLSNKPSILTVDLRIWDRISSALLMSCFQNIWFQNIPPGWTILSMRTISIVWTNGDLLPNIDITHSIIYQI